MLASTGGGAKQHVNTRLSKVHVVIYAVRRRSARRRTNSHLRDHVVDDTLVYESTVYSG